MAQFCDSPFASLDVLQDHYTPCCADHLARDAQVFTTATDPRAIWNAEPLVSLRTRILAGDWSSCSACPRWLQNRCYGPREEYYRPVMDRGPRWINWANDPSCNLHCWTCRNGPYAGQDPRSAEVFARLNAAWLPTAERVSLSHLGDPLASPLYRNWLTSLDGSRYARLRIRLFTNGLLLPQWWGRLGRIHANIDAIWQSIDAASPAGYERIRRGGRWRDLSAAIAFVSDLRHAGGIQDWLWSFVVMASNFREMPQFVRWARSSGATAVWFGRLVPRPHHGPDLRTEDLFAPGHPDWPEYCELCNDPIFDDPIVSYGFFRPSVAGRTA